ncbi:MAG: zinc metalloprotease [Deltaproteobacteria bacterium]|nr:zinc metalloprotease [Deltaproteobacteria bacterium]
MSAFRINPVFLAVLVILTFVLAAKAESRPHSTFSTQADGQVVVDGLAFGSMQAYLNSDYFRLSGKRCGTMSPERIESDQGSAQKSLSDCTTAQTVIQNEYWPNTVLTIPVVVHIIHKTDGTGNLDDGRINRQIDVLNKDYAAMAGTLGEEGFNTMIQFRLETVTRTANDNWFDDNDEEIYKTALGWDRSRYCNIYVNSAGGNLGYAYFPQDSPGVRDGLVIFYDVFGGRREGIAPYNQGRTAVHEMGHYLGLYHTFEGYEACQNTYTTGDLIVDTPAEAEDHYGCTQTSTCASPDPIHNYMNYTDDSCMNQFTREQANRMVCSLLNYRPDLAVDPPKPRPITPVFMLLLDD